MALAMLANVKRVFLFLDFLMKANKVEFSGILTNLMHMPLYSKSNYLYKKSEWMGSTYIIVELNQTSVCKKFKRNATLDKFLHKFDSIQHDTRVHGTFQRVGL
jgi:hypothetical protein